MHRLDEIRSYMENCIKEQVENSISAEREYLNNASSEVKNKLVFKIRQVLKNSGGNAQNVMVCYLYSSIAEEKCELCLFSFKDFPFIIMPENETYMDYSEILKLHVVSMEYLKKEIRKKFVQLCPYEIEEIRREFMYRYSAGIGKLLRSVLNNEEGNIRVFFGTYMGEYEEIGRVLV